MKLRLGLALALACASCAAAPHGPAESLRGTDGAVHPIAPLEGDRYAVVIFFSADCHVLRAHDDRIRQLAADFAPRGVRFWAVDSEVGATLERDRAEVARRGYGFPILLDPGAAVAKTFGAEYAGHTVVLDRAGHVVYRGGIDSDRVHLTDDAAPFLRDALADLVAGRPPRVAEAKVLGCVIRTW